MKSSLGISNFLEETSSLSHFIVFLYFFTLIAEEGFLISPCYSLELCIQMLISFLADGDCRHEIKRLLLLGRKVMTNLDSILKIRHISLSNGNLSSFLLMMEFQLSYFKSWNMMLWKCCTQYASKFGKLSSDHRTGKGQFSFQSQILSSQGLVFLVVMSGCKSRTIKKSWAQNWCFWTVELEKTLECPLNCKRANQSILKEISPGCLLEGLMLKLKLQYFGHEMRRADSFEKTLMLGKIEGRRKRGRQDEMVRWHHQLNGHEFG